MSALATDRGATWSCDEVKTLIGIWADEKVQHQLDNCTKKVPVFQNIAKRLEEAGFTRTVMQIREKLKKLKQQYKKVKDNNNCSGRERKTFEFFYQMDEIMGGRPITKPESLLESGARAGDSEEKSGSFDDDIDYNECEEIDVGKSIEKEVYCSMAEPLDSTANSVSSSLSSALSDDNVIKKTLARKETFTSSTKQGKGKKRSRSEMFLSSALEAISKQQELADARFFKMEEERFHKELEIEEKRRREEMQHEINMMQMMGNILSQFSSSVHYGQRPPPVHNENQTIFYSYNSPHLNANGPTSCGTNPPSGNEEKTEGPYYTSL